MSDTKGGTGRQFEAMEASVDGMAILNTEDEYVYVNQAHVDVYGYDDEEDLLGNTWRMLYEDEEIERIENEILPELERDDVWRGEATGTRADGTEFPQELSLSHMEDGGLICVVRDITERKERERELERYEAFVESSPDAIVHMGDDGTVLYTSPTVEDVLGYEQEEMVGDDAFEYVHPDDRDTVKDVFVSAVNGKDTGEENTSFRAQHADGGYVWVENAGADARDREYQTEEGIVLSLRDITERKERERELERYEAFVENSSDSITHVDESGEILYRSPSSGRVEDEPGEMTGSSAFEHIHPEDRDHVAEKFFSLLSDPDRRTDSVEYRSERADGTYEWVEAVATDQRDTEVGGVVVNTRVIEDRKEREKELKRYETFVENSSDIVSHIGEDGTVMYYSPSAERILGHGPEERIGERAFDYIHPDDRGRLMGLAESVTEGDKERAEAEFRARDGDGNYVWLEAAGTDQRDTEVGGFVVNVRDITDRKEREKELERYEAFVKSTSDVVTHVDENGKIVYNSPSIEDVFGYEQDETVGDDAFGYIHPEDRERMMELFEATVSDEGDTGNENTEFRIRDSDGDYVWVEDAAGDPAETGLDGLVLNLRDITDRKEREKELERYEAFLENSLDIFSVLDEEGRHVYNSPSVERILGYDREEHTGEYSLEYVHPDDMSRTIEWFYSLVEGEERIDETELRYRNADGEYVWFEVIGTDKTDTEVGGVVFNARDITERKQREDELRKEQKAMDTVLSNVPLVAFTLDEDGVFTRSQGKALSRIGLEPGEVVGESIFEFYGDRPDIKEDIERALSGETVRTTVEASGRTFESWYEPLEDEEGRVEGLVGMAYDVTEREERERELERYEAFVEHSSDVVTLVEDDGTIRYFSPSVEYQAGHSPEERMGDNIYEYVHPEDKEQVIETYSKLLDEPETRALEEEFRYQRGDGSYVWVEARGTDQRDTDLGGIVVNARDITERKEREKELERYEALVENTSDMVMVLDEGGTILYQSPSVERVMGYGQDERIGEEGFEYVHPDDRQKAAEAFQEVIEDPEMGSAKVEVRSRRADGDYVWLEVRGSDRRDTDVGGIVTTSRDITERKEREKELERYEAYIRNSSDIITHIDEEGNVVYQSPAAERILGRDPEGRLGEDAIKHVHPEDRESVTEMLESLFTDPGKGQVEMEFRSQREDGEYVWLETVGVDRTDTEIGGVIANSRDVTERKRNKQKLERSRELLSHTERIADTGGWEYRVDEDELRWTEGTYDVHGVSRDFELNTEKIGGLYHPEDSEELGGLIRRCIKEKEPYEDVFRITHPEGDTDSENGDGVRWVRTNGVPITEDGEVVKIRGAVQDITEQKRRESELRRSRELLGHTERIADTGGWELDAETEELRWTDGTKRIHDLPTEYEPTLEEGVEFYHPDDREEVRDAVYGCLLEGEPYDEELRLRTAEDTAKWVRTLGEPVREGDEVVRIRGAIQDITERKQRERELRERKDQIDFFNSLLRHDLLNSMTVIQGNAELLEEELSDSGRREVAKKITKHSTEIIELTERVRSVLRRLTEEDTTEVSPVDLNDVVEKRCERLEETYPDASCRLDGTEGVCVMADSFLDHVLNNVLVNAVEHNDKEEPRVEVTVQEDEETATVRVADNGPGIPDEKKETVFDQGATGRTSGGVGFGLYYVEAMVSEYGGEVRVEDNTPEGTVFVMELPKAEQKKEDTGERNIKMKTDMEQGGKGETDGGKKSDRRKTED